MTLSFLIATDGTGYRVKGYVQANANVGIDGQTLVNLVTRLLPYVGYPRTLNAISCLIRNITAELIHFFE
jgi:4-carboxymuconolactone decarboxylase